MKTTLRLAYTVVIAVELMLCVMSAQTQTQAWDEMHEASVTNQQILSVKAEGCIKTTLMKHSTWSTDQVVAACR